MAANMLLQMSKHDPTNQWTEASLRKFLETMNARVGVKEAVPG